MMDTFDANLLSEALAVTLAEKRDRPGRREPCVPAANVRPEVARAFRDAADRQGMTRSALGAAVLEAFVRASQVA